MLFATTQSTASCHVHRDDIDPVRNRHLTRVSVIDRYFYTLTPTTFCLSLAIVGK